jgi:presenilin-like A22 family membrane protease
MYISVYWNRHIRTTCIIYCGKTINKTYVIPDKLDVRIKKQAADERSTQSNIFVKAAEEYLKRNEK